MQLEYQATFETIMPKKGYSITNQLLATPETKNFNFEIYVRVSNLNHPSIEQYFTIKCEYPTTIFKGMTYFEKFLVIAVEKYVYLIDLKELTSQTHNVGGYFHSFKRFSDSLLVITYSRIGRIDSHGNLIWRSLKLGNEGIEIINTSSQTIEGRGRWYNSDSWLYFSLNTSNGKTYLPEKRRIKPKIYLFMTTRMLTI